MMHPSRGGRSKGVRQSVVVFGLIATACISFVFGRYYSAGGADAKLQPVAVVEKVVAPCPATTSAPSFTLNLLKVLEVAKSQTDSNPAPSNSQVSVIPPSDYKLPSFITPSSEHKLCVIVPFRDSGSKDKMNQGQDRTDNLREFVPYMRGWLRAQGRTFKIIVAEQEQGGYFNKGAMFNAGVQLSNGWCDYFALHDVDYVPLHKDNGYAWQPKWSSAQRSSALHLHRDTDLEGFLFIPSVLGGAVLMSAQHFKAINGFSNAYWGWGREDDDLYMRVSKILGEPDHLNPQVGWYRPLKHTRVHGLDETPQFAANNAYYKKASAISAQTYTAADGFAQLAPHMKVATTLNRDPDFEHYIVSIRGLATNLATEAATSK